MTLPQDDYIKTALRLPRELHAEIKDAAEYHGRSMNAEIISRLESAGVTLSEIAQQNIKTQGMIQQIIDAISMRR
jgi:predicted transcriptional regulator